MKTEYFSARLDKNIFYKGSECILKEEFFLTFKL